MESDRRVKVFKDADADGGKGECSTPCSPGFLPSTNLRNHACIQWWWWWWWQHQEERKALYQIYKPQGSDEEKKNYKISFLSSLKIVMTKTVVSFYWQLDFQQLPLQLITRRIYSTFLYRTDRKKMAILLGYKLCRSKCRTIEIEIHDELVR